MSVDGLAAEHFPPLSQGQPSSQPLPRLDHWKAHLSVQDGKEVDFIVTHHIIENKRFSLSEEQLQEGQEEWLYSLVGYALGKRPFYGSLLEAIKRKWSFKGSLQLLTMEGDFFLFKFNYKEDFDLVWSSGPCFLNGRPFLFQKWTRGFTPSKGDIKEIPLWIKLPNFPLCCWTEVGISKAASVVGIPLAVDKLTASKNRITFARVCVLVNPDSELPDSFEIDMNGTIITQPIHYDWKPSACSQCRSFSHDDSRCPKSSKIPPPARGRSRSRPAGRPRLARQNQRTSPALASQNTPSHSSDQEILPQTAPIQQPVLPPLPPPTNSNLPPLLPTPTCPAAVLATVLQSTLNDLNQLPALSPPQDDLLTVISPAEDDTSWEQPRRPIRQPGMITRSSALSPARLAVLAASTQHSPGDSTDSSIKGKTQQDHSEVGRKNNKKKKGMQHPSSS